MNIMSFHIEHDAKWNLWSVMKEVDGKKESIYAQFYYSKDSALHALVRYIQEQELIT